MPSKYGYPDGVRRMLIDIYGNNLTSNTEPEEILIVERRDIINRYKGILGQQDPKNYGYPDYLQGQKDLLESLYASKCVANNKEQTCPIFKAGDKVRIIDELVATFGSLSVITKVQIEEGEIIGYWIDDEIGFYLEAQLESYTESEPKFSKGDKILWLGKERIIKDVIIPGNSIMYEFEGCTGLLTEAQIASCNKSSNELKH